MEFRVLGPLEVFDGHIRMEIAGRKERALLVALALRAGEATSTSQLISTLWDDGPPRTVIKVLQTYVFRLRRALAPHEVLETHGSSYVLAVSRRQVDALRFEDLVGSAREAWRAQDAAQTSALLGEALSLWRGDPSVDGAGTTAAQAQFARLSEMRLTAAEDRFDAELALGRHADAIGELEAMVAAHPFRERLWGLLILALYRSARQAEALRTFNRARSHLVDQLGIEPSPVLRDLEAAILAQDRRLDLSRSAQGTTEGGAGPTDTARYRWFVGRQREQTQLSMALEAARRGSGSLFLVTGEPGIGKTRLAEEAVQRARATGVRVAWGSAWEVGGAPPFWPWMESLRSIADDIGPDALAAAARDCGPTLGALLPSLAGQFPVDEARPVGLASDEARFALFDATARFLERAARDRPLLLVLDDMHAADEPSLRLLAFVARHVRNCSLVVLATSREVEARLVPWVGAALAGATRFGHRLPLRGLSGEEVRELVEHTGELVPTPEVVAEVYAATAGNPFFVDELVRLIASEGQLRSDDTAPVPAFHVPGGVRETVRRRLGPLSDDSRDVMATAAVLGRVFDLNVVQSAVSRPLAEVVTLVHEAVALDLVVAESDSPMSFRFVHALVRNSLYEDLTALDRAERHRRVAEALELSLARSASELAHHFRAAMAVGGAAMALRYSMAAAEEAMEHLAFEDAVLHYRHALETLDTLAEGDPLQRGRILVALSDACFAAGDTAERSRLVLEAAAVARCHDDAELLGEAARRAPILASDGEPAMSLITEALARLPSGPSTLRVLLLRRLAVAEGNSMFSERAGRTLRDALAAARKLGDAEVLMETLDCVDYLLPYDPDEHAAAAAELAAVALEARSTSGLVRARKFRVREKLHLGDLAGADIELAHHRLLAQESRFRPARLSVKRWRALRLMLDGRFDEAEGVALEVLAEDERAAKTLRMVTMYHLWMEQGRHDKLEPALRELVVGSPQYPWRARLAAALAEHGRVADARSEFEVLAEHGFADVDGYTADFVLPLLAEVCAVVGDEPRAEILMRRLSPAAGRCVVVGGAMYACTGAVARYLGLLASGLGRWDDAERLLGDALACHQAMPSPPLVARTQYDLANMLARRGRPVDAGRVSSLAGECQGAAEHMGMRRLAEKARLLGVPAGLAAPAWPRSAGNGSG